MNRLPVTIESFGFCHQDDQPVGHALLFDVRGLLPRAAAGRQTVTGLDPQVRGQARHSECAEELVERIAGETAALLAYAGPRGRGVHVLIGGTDGVYGSVAVAEWAGETLRQRLGADGPSVEVTHRHITRSAVRP
ncbi:RapZ C-terminal domain-containing protein [Streptomyces olivaceus]|uniref:RapZ C-terminal domain-containing protein n=1 Tax=Streptomyces olivaceus TaxID=47716 RepID=UPI003714D45C